MRLQQQKVGLSGLEPETSRLSGGCSNQLSYKPMSSESGVPTSGSFSSAFFLRKIAMKTKLTGFGRLLRYAVVQRAVKLEITCVGTAKDVVRGSAHMFWQRWTILGRDPPSGSDKRRNVVTTSPSYP